MGSLYRFLCISFLVFCSTVVQATEPVEIDYMTNCQGCHLPDGSGYPAHGVPSLSSHMGKFLQVEGGREFLVQVPGSAMSDLSDDRLTAVLNWMLETFSPDQLPQNFSPYTESEVNKLRENVLVFVTETRQQLLKRIEKLEQATHADS